MTDERIHELFGHVPYFVDHIIEPMPDNSAQDIFMSSYYWCARGSINPLLVNGTMHPDYAGKTWRWLLEHGRRMDLNLRLFQSNPEYYLDLVKRIPGMHFSFIDGQGYVTEDGNHRTCIAKFFLCQEDTPYLHGVTFSEQHTDFRMLGLYQHLLTRLPRSCRALSIKKEVHRDDGVDWAKHSYEISIRLENIQRPAYHAVFSANELEQVFLPALAHPLRRFGEFRKLLY